MKDRRDAATENRRNLRAICRACALARYTERRRACLRPPCAVSTLVLRSISGQLPSR